MTGRDLHRRETREALRPDALGAGAGRARERRRPREEAPGGPPDQPASTPPTPNVAAPPATGFGVEPVVGDGGHHSPGTQDRRCRADQRTTVGGAWSIHGIDA